MFMATCKNWPFWSTHMYQILSINVEIPFYPGFRLDLSGKTGPQSNGDDSCFLLQGKPGFLLEFYLIYLLVFITTDANLRKGQKSS